MLLPLYAGSGLIVLPPLCLWLVHESNRCSKRLGDPSDAKVARSIGITLFVVCLCIVAFYLLRYKTPPHPLPTSFGAVLSTLLAYLSLMVWPSASDHWRLAGLIVVILIAPTHARLC